MARRICYLSVLALCFAAVRAKADPVGYTFDLTTFYVYSPGQCDSFGIVCAAPDTGFLTFANNGNSIFTGTLTLSGTSLLKFADGGPFCNPNGIASESFTGSLGPGSSLTFGLSADSSDCGGWNGGLGALFSIVGTVNLNGVTESVDLLVHDSQIVSATSFVSPCDGLTANSYILQGGSPTGCDTLDDFEKTLPQGNYEFFQSTVPEPASLLLLGGGLLGVAFLKGRKKAAPTRATPPDSH